MSMFALLAAVATATPAPVFVERPCADSQLAGSVRCGTVTVPENREAPDRTIALNVIVLPATGPEPHAPPLFDIEGGPGLPVAKNVAFYTTFGAAYRERRDIVLVDQRGTGGSNPLHCPELANPEMAYAPLYPADAISRCRQSLSETADLTQYGTDAAAADLDTVRAALGYDKLDLFGLSYGSTVALRYLKNYPQNIRAAVLVGVAPATARPPSSHAPAAERALGMLFDRCKADPDCSAGFDPDADLAQARAKLSAIADAPSDEVFMEKLRSLMYQPPTARRIPFILNRAAQGALEPLYAATKPFGHSLFALGMGISVVCAEGMGLMDFPAATEAARGTRFGDYRLRRQQVACAEWPVAKVASDFLQPVESDAAVLLVSGELDPVTPPSWADEVAATLPNSRHIVIPGSGHIFDGMSGIDTCLDPIILAFLDTGDAKALDASCLDSMKAPPFVTSDEPKGAS